MAVNAVIAPAHRAVHLDVARWSFTVLVIAMLATSAAFVGYRLSSPSDGTKVGGMGNPYAPGGVTVDESHGHPAPAGLMAGDRAVALEGRPIGDWLDSVVDPNVGRPTFVEGDAISYTVERAGQPVAVAVVAARFDPGAALAEDWGVLLFALSMQIVGIYLFVRRPREPAARALFVAGTGMFASSVPWALGLQVSDFALGTSFWLYAAATGVAYALLWSGALHFALVFPRHIPFAASRRRILLLAYAAPIGGLLAAIALVGLVTGHVQPALQAWLTGQGLIEVGAIACAIGLMSYSYWRLVDPIGRRQLRLVAGAVGLASVSALGLWFGPQLLTGAPLIPRSAVALLGLPIPITLAMAVNRHHLFDLDTVLNRSLVYGGLTAGVVATYAATVAVLSRFIPGNGPFAAALLGAGAVAVLALPLRDRLQRSVHRMLYGDRDEPENALRRLGQRLEASLDPQTVLSTLVDTVAEALRSPFAAIELERDGVATVEAAHGAVPMDVAGNRRLERFPIVYRGQIVGRLVLCTRAADEPFSPADRRLVADLARQAGPAVEAVRLTTDLRRSREELVTAREEERRRLRRDLHDELGPAMAGSLMKLRAARSLMAAEPSRAAALLDDVEGDVGGLVEEVRRIARNLRPPSLDELGLLGVLRMRAAAFDEGPQDSGLKVSLEAPDELPPLPAAVEVAGLRIALEGLTNAARHSGASRARISISMDGDALVVAVTDDGTGVPADVSPGVGLTSMRERADELGGTMELLSPKGGGTTLIARLPVAGSVPP
jgi:signal transduction histidine kinase